MGPEGTTSSSDPSKLIEARRQLSSSTSSSPAVTDSVSASAGGSAAAAAATAAAARSSFSSSNKPYEKLSPPRQSRKPSPGLAARLKALGFGSNRERRSSSNASGSAEAVGRIPEDQIRYIDHAHQANSRDSVIERRGRAWTGVSEKLTLQHTGDSFTSSLSEDIPFLGSESGEGRSAQRGSSLLEEEAVEVEEEEEEGERERVKAMRPHDEAEDIDAQKFRMPEHTNSNGIKVMTETKTAHIERENPPKDDMTCSPPIFKEMASDVTAAEPSDDVQSYFNPLGLQRAGSIYTLSRVSFASQLAQLTSLQLPDAGSLSSRVSAIPTSQAASKVLTAAADQIRSWISKASEVLGGLDADDDVEWAAIGGREGLEEVDNCVRRFEELINVYVVAIEELQGRDDISNVPSSELKNTVTQVESILNEWEKIRSDLKRTKASVEMALEYEELCNGVLGDIGNEADTLSQLVFEMEEKRHKSLNAEQGGGDSVDLGELETIVEDSPSARPRANQRLSLQPSFPMSPGSPGTPTVAQDDSSLLALFARMQPLRASLDFLPMRLSTFHNRAETVFPTACAELEEQREALEQLWKKLEKDAESLRRELGEDRWVLVFRGAGRQAQNLHESIDRSLSKLREAVETESQLSQPPTLGKKIENYEAKKIHYGPAIERVLVIVARGLKERLTVNGEIVRLLADTQGKWDGLKERMRGMDAFLEELQNEKRGQQLRDSISSLVSSNDHSTVGSQQGETPGSSPASSVIMSGLSGGLDNYHHHHHHHHHANSPSSSGAPTTTTTPTTVGGGSGGGGKGSKLRTSSSRMSYLPQPGSNRRSVSMTESPTMTTSSQQATPARRGPMARLSTYASSPGRPSLSPSSPSSYFSHGAASRGSGSATPTGNRAAHQQSSSQQKQQHYHNRPPLSASNGRPPWNSSVNTNSAGAAGHAGHAGHSHAHHGLSKSVSAASTSSPPGGGASRIPLRNSVTGNSLSFASPSSSSSSSPLSSSARPTTTTPLSHSSSSRPAAGHTSSARLSFRDRERLPPSSPSPGPSSFPLVSAATTTTTTTTATTRPRNALQTKTSTPAQGGSSRGSSAAQAAAAAQQQQQQQQPQRPASSLAASASRRASSLLPHLKGGATAAAPGTGRPGSRLMTGRESPQAVTGAAEAMRREGSGQAGAEGPKWRGS